MNELSLLDTFFGSPRFNFGQNTCLPSVDVIESKDSYTLMMDLPGRSENDVDLSLKDGVLTISSVKEASSEKKGEKNENFLIKERTVSQFKRSFSLPKDIDDEKVGATFKNGVLTVTIPRHAQPAEKKIAITAA